MKYVDGFVQAVPSKHLAWYKRVAQKCGKIWREHGALAFMECAGDDMNVRVGVPFPRQLKTKPGEIVIFSYIIYRSRAHRDRVNAKVMKDPRLKGLCNPANMPFDMSRMLYGGFKVIVDA